MSVTYDKKRNRYYARITLDGTRRYLGSFDTEREAERAYDLEQIIFDSRKRMAEMSKNFTLEAYRPVYIENDSSFAFVETKKALRALAERVRLAFILAVFTRWGK